MTSLKLWLAVNSFNTRNYTTTYMYRWKGIKFTATRRRMEMERNGANLS